jgi:ParB family transcriptional regulator, chromosome partitioning protein
MTKSALGRGLGALLGGGVPPAKPSPLAAPAAQASAPQPAVVPQAIAAGPGPRQVPVERVRPCPFQPRKDFTGASIQELADSIREQGILQPLVVREREGFFELIAGERRWRAAQKAGLTEVPVVLREADDRTVLELALVENLQRENLNPIEEAQGFAHLIEQFALTQEQAATKVGKSRVVVANALRLLKLPATVQAYLRDGHLSVGHAKVILGLPGTAEQQLVAERVLREGLNVRQTEELVAGLLAAGPATGKRTSRKSDVSRDTHVAALENRLQERLGTKVSLRYREGKGAIEVRFFNDDDLERVLQVMGVSAD